MCDQEREQYSEALNRWTNHQQQSWTKKHSRLLIVLAILLNSIALLDQTARFLDQLVAKYEWQTNLPFWIVSIGNWWTNSILTFSAQYKLLNLTSAMTIVPAWIMAIWLIISIGTPREFAVLFSRKELASHYATVCKRIFWHYGLALAGFNIIAGGGTFIIVYSIVERQHIIGPLFYILYVCINLSFLYIGSFAISNILYNKHYWQIIFLLLWLLWLIAAYDWRTSLLYIGLPPKTGVMFGIILLTAIIVYPWAIYLRIQTRAADLNEQL